jgi:tetratricopeptide (TPR) repeat protein
MLRFDGRPAPDPTATNFRFSGWCALVVLLTGCASRQPLAPPRDLLEESHAELRAGCYRCLESGLALVAHRSGRAFRQRAFELALLLTVRAKELGLPFQPWLERAKGFAADSTPLPSPAAFLQLVEAFRQDSAGLDRDQDFAQRSTLTLDRARTLLASIEASDALPETRFYFALVGTCAFAREDVSATVARLAPAIDGVPLLEYARGRCEGEPWFLRALRDEPRFDDAAYPIVRIRTTPLATSEHALDAVAMASRARAAFPGSAAIAFAEAALHRERREWTHALAGYDRTLQLVPRHHDARLGRAIALSNLGRHEDGIAAATSLIDEGTWLVGDAFYWRAWNEFNLERFVESERDVEESKSRMRWSAVWVLSGLIRWRTQRLADAESEFGNAMNLAADDCDAATYRAGVRAAMRNWLPAAAAFTEAAICRQNEVRTLRSTLDTLIARAASEATVAAQRTSIAKVETLAAELEKKGEAVMSVALDAYRLRPHSFCEVR